MTGMLYLFIKRHPTLLQLHISVFLGAPFAEPSVELPNLVVFRGSRIITPKFLKNPIKMASVWLNSIHLDDLGLFSSCRDVVVEVQPGLDMQDMFKRLKQQLPRLKSCLLLFHRSVSLTPSILAQGLSGFEQLESFGLVGSGRDADIKFISGTKPMVRSCLDNCPSLQECIFLKSANDSTGRYKIVDGKAEHMTGPCHIETVFRTPILSA
ncbi:hypothetical protein C8J56DRAFT_459734 [Mycena floridula]|nr:hypothetical protein C8J56DRAFT_459734 [Mycena floridula]